MTVDDSTALCAHATKGPMRQTSAGKAGRARLYARGRLPAAMQRGFSMIEMSIAVAVGLVVTSAVLYTVSMGQSSSKRQEVQASMSDMGQMAMMQITEHVRMTGFWMPSSEVLSTDASMNGTRAIMGCDKGFVDPHAAWGNLTCRTGAGYGALALRFQVQPSGRNWDCAGNEIRNAAMNAAAAASVNLTGTPYVPPAPNLIQEEIEERYYVKTTPTGNQGLYCKASSANAEVLLTDNVEEFGVRYGVSPLNTVFAQQNSAFDRRALEGRTEQYLNASELTGSCSATQVEEKSWCAVTSVRICLRLGSANSVADPSINAFVNCDGVASTVTDRRVYQTHTAIVALRNKLVVQQ